MLLIRIFTLTIVVGFLLSVNQVNQKKQRNHIHKTKTESTPKPVGALSIDVGFIKRDGSVQKIARNEFSIVTKSLNEILLLADYGSE